MGKSGRRSRILVDGTTRATRREAEAETTHLIRECDEAETAAPPGHAVDHDYGIYDGPERIEELEEPIVGHFKNENRVERERERER